MKHPRQPNSQDLGLYFIAEVEQRIKKQKQIIARLKRKGQPTAEAEAVLLGFERSLLQLRNHWDVMQELMKPEMAPVRLKQAD
jgi:hypothetical protein